MWLQLVVGSRTDLQELTRPYPDARSCNWQWRRRSWHRRVRARRTWLRRCRGCIPDPAGGSCTCPTSRATPFTTRRTPAIAAAACAIPTVPVRETIWPVAGDNTAHLQAAIDRVSALPLDAAGFRGAVLLRAGYYRVAGAAEDPGERRRVARRRHGRHRHGPDWRPAPAAPAPVRVAADLAVRRQGALVVIGGASGVVTRRRRRSRRSPTTMSRSARAACA